jgi:hypothetical protein
MVQGAHAPNPAALPGSVVSTDLASKPADPQQLALMQQAGALAMFLQQQQQTQSQVERATQVRRLP